MIVKKSKYLDGKTKQWILSVNEINLQLINRCPTLNNIINCRECQHECKLRLTTNIDEVKVPPEPILTEIYY